MNKSIICGNLGQDPEIRFTQSGTCIASLRVATSRYVKGKDGGTGQNVTQWHRCVAFGNVAERIERNRHYLKGAKVLIEGMYLSKMIPGSNGREREVFELHISDISIVSFAKHDTLGQSNAEEPITPENTTPQLKDESGSSNAPRGFASDEDFT